ncbi:MAG: hypothetical protein VW378_00075 [bacterium]
MSSSSSSVLPPSVPKGPRPVAASAAKAAEEAIAASAASAASAAKAAEVAIAARLDRFTGGVAPSAPAPALASAPDSEPNEGVARGGKRHTEGLRLKSAYQTLKDEVEGCLVLLDKNIQDCLIRGFFGQHVTSIPDYTSDNMRILRLLKEDMKVLRPVNSQISAIEETTTVEGLQKEVDELRLDRETLQLQHIKDLTSLRAEQKAAKARISELKLLLAKQGVKEGGLQNECDSLTKELSRLMVESSVEKVKSGRQLATARSKSLALMLRSRNEQLCLNVFHSWIIAVKNAKIEQSYEEVTRLREECYRYEKFIDDSVNTTCDEIESLPSPPPPPPPPQQQQQPRVSDIDAQVQFILDDFLSSQSGHQEAYDRIERVLREQSDSFQTPKSISLDPRKAVDTMIQNILMLDAGSRVFLVLKIYNRIKAEIDVLEQRRAELDQGVV